MDGPKLPGALGDIETVVGREAALRLARQLGGRSVHVPQPGHLTAEHPVSTALGMRAARQLADRFQGEKLYIPMGRQTEVQALAAQGLSTKEIAARLRISERSVQRLRRATPVA